MITIRKSQDRGHATQDWLDSYHTFSFADYYDADHMGFRSLRVINDDRIKAGAGFDRHPHRNMEILTYVLEGELKHEDSMGNGSVLRYGDVQRMTAGTGVLHSEFNASPINPLHLLQIWILPQETNLAPGYEEKHFTEDEKRNQLRLIASPQRDGKALHIHQDIRLYSSLLETGKSVSYELLKGRHAWLQVAKGEVELNSIKLKEGDAASISAVKSLNIRAVKLAEFLLFDLQ